MLRKTVLIGFVMVKLAITAGGVWAYFHGGGPFTAHAAAGVVEEIAE